ncbi:HPr family phosphocarrier protein [Microbacterium sp. H83]|uniref:HPr family phosphocarrier protein n=1 Tax=Microbacterium sp. H83 TaxID=1827324 RepID=UPI0007F4D93D|nr:HPr family phosphocarrier protein [Microbacterium sp. H83]OAN40924.1 hypothetical protein A4X16_01975 [Microbacterium sp. H83]
MTAEARGTVVVNNPSGLHARPANELARVAKSLSSSSRLAIGDREVNAASVLAIMTLGVTPGTAVDVICEGDMAEEDLDTLLAAIRGGLGEPNVPNGVNS